MFDKEKKAVEFFNYDSSWGIEAEKTIKILKTIFEDKAADIQHIGGTAMKKIKSKPVIDIVVGITDLSLIDSFKDILNQNDFVCNPGDEKTYSDRILFFKSNQNKKTHIIHIVKYCGKLWFDYIIFRDYLNFNENKAREFESLKLSLNGKYRYALPSYIKIKSDFINKTVSANFYTMMLGKNITIELNDKESENYPKLDDGIYPINSGNITDLDIRSYVIGVYDYNMAEMFTGKITAYIRCKNKNKNGNGYEKCFVISKDNLIFYKPDISEALKFYFDSNYNDIVADIVCMYEKSCGAVVYTKDGENIKFLLVKGSASKRVGFPKGHIEKGEIETETAVREIYEETSLNVVLYSDFKEEYSYTISGYVKKTVVYFLAEFNNLDKYKIRDNEILEQWLVPYEKAYDMLTFVQDKAVLKKAYERIKK